ncbi:MAG: hypothetical protein WB729_07050 [Candidatus Sulfotelmatobacter sp.]
MRHREEWQPVLDAEVRRWSSKSSDQLITELPEVRGYEVEFDGKKYQVEVEILENTEKQIHVSVSVDDGKLLASIRPLSQSFVREKTIAKR